MEVGDKVILLPLGNMKGNVVTIAPAKGVIAEGDYTTWTHKWTNTLPDGLTDGGDSGWLIDEKNGVLSVGWYDASSYVRFGIFNLEDFSTVFLSPSEEHYLVGSPTLYDYTAISLGNSYLLYGGISRSLQSYILLLRPDGWTIEVWRGGASPLWSHNTTTEVESPYVDSGSISLQGKYVLIVTHDGNLILYEGS